MNAPAEQQGSLWALLVAALTLRILLMPITLHSDLLFIQYFPTYLSLRGHWDVYGHLGDHFLQRGFTYYPPLVLYTIAFFQKCFAGLAPEMPRFIEQFHSSFYPGAGGAMREYWAGFNVWERMRLTAWMKLPYLAADAVIAGVLLRGWGGARGRRALEVWCWSPVVLYGTYLFGQYRNISCAVLVAALWMSRSGREKSFYILLGVAALYENFVWALMPFILLSRANGVRAATTSLLCFMAAPVVVLGPLVLSSGSMSLYSYVSPVIARAASTGILRSYPEVVPLVCKTLLAACLLLVLAAILLWGRRGRSGSSHRSTILVCLSVLFSIYATSVTMVHYFLWAMPFLLAARAEPDGVGVSGRILWPMTALLFIFNLDSSTMHMGLLSPIAPDLTGPHSLHEALAPCLPWGKIIAVCRLTFSALCLYVAASSVWGLRTRSIDPASAAGV